MHPERALQRYRATVANSEANFQRRTQLSPRPYIHYIQLLANSVMNLEAVAYGAQ
jgi:hypothetical protein